MPFDKAGTPELYGSFIFYLRAKIFKSFRLFCVSKNAVFFFVPEAVMFYVPALRP
jgi:hypothetical protein